MHLYVFNILKYLCDTLNATNVITSLMSEDQLIGFEEMLDSNSSQ